MNITLSWPQITTPMVILNGTIFLLLILEKMYNIDLTSSICSSLTVSITLAWNLWSTHKEMLCKKVSDGSGKEVISATSLIIWKENLVGITQVYHSHSNSTVNLFPNHRRQRQCLHRSLLPLHLHTITKIHQRTLSRSSKKK